jgi:hypothetical protein
MWTVDDGDRRRSRPRTLIYECACVNERARRPCSVWVMSVCIPELASLYHEGENLTELVCVPIRVLLHAGDSNRRSVVAIVALPIVANSLSLSANAIANLQSLTKHYRY